MESFILHYDDFFPGDHEKVVSGPVDNEFIPLPAKDDGSDHIAAGRLAQLLLVVEDIEMLLDQIDSESSEEGMDVDELSRKIAKLEILNDLDESDEDWNDIPATNHADVNPVAFTEEEDSWESGEDPNEESNGDEEKEETEVAEQTDDNVLPTPTSPAITHSPRHSLQLAHLLSDTVSLTRSSSQIPDELNTRLFMLSQQLTSDIPGMFERR